MNLLHLFKPAGTFLPLPAIPPGRRVYAVGDVHGRLDLLDTLLARIDANDALRPAAETTIIFLGDLVDRGPDSAAVIDRVLELSRESRDVRCIMGNHEETLLAALAGKENAMRFFTRIGGQETILSYGVSEDEYLAAADYPDLGVLLAARMPAAHRAFLEGMERYVEIGDYLFVHAGIRPDVPLADQSGTDLRWIRSNFLQHIGDHGRMVVHGHTITAEVDERPNRIGIDTGAYRTDRLTALGLEGTARWLLDTAK